jgi:hypothetical protein
MSNNKKSEADFIHELSEVGRNIYGNLIKVGKSRQWLCKKMGISIVTLNLRLKKGTLSEDEISLVNKFINEL